MQRHAASVGAVVVSVVFPPHFQEIYRKITAKEDKLDRNQQTCVFKKKERIVLIKDIRTKIHHPRMTRVINWCQGTFACVILIA